MTHTAETTGATGERVEHVDGPEGPVAAAFLSAGAGALALGVLTTLAEASTSINDFLNFYHPVGPLSGKTILAVGVWLATWVVLHIAYRRRAVERLKVVTAVFILIGLGVIGTFPVFFQTFAPGE